MAQKKRKEKKNRCLQSYSRITFRELVGLKRCGPPQRQLTTQRFFHTELSVFWHFEPYFEFFFTMNLIVLV